MGGQRHPTQFIPGGNSPYVTDAYRDALSHYTDWTIGHVHAGALGWVAMISIGALYHMIPKIFGREQMYSLGLINAHFWLATIGTVLYIASMWVNGIAQGLMWRAVNEDGTLTYSFVETLVASHPGFIVRLVGGAVFLSGMFLMAYNTWRTVRSAIEEVSAVFREKGLNVVTQPDPANDNVSLEIGHGEIGRAHV